MKRNKKLMLTAIAAMGVVAMGVGGAGTFAWYSVAPLVNGSADTASLTVLANSVTSGEVTFSASTKYYKFDKTEQTTANQKKFLPATNAGSAGGTPITSGSYSEIVSTPTWKSYVKTGETTYSEDTAGMESNAAYAVITYDLQINTASTVNLGNYAVTLTKGAGYAKYASNLKILVEGIGVKANAVSVGTDSFAAIVFEGGSVNNVKTVATNAAAGHYSFRVIIWYDGTLVNDSTDYETDEDIQNTFEAKDILVATASYQA